MENKMREKIIKLILVLVFGLLSGVAVVITISAIKGCIQ